MAKLAVSCFSLTKFDLIIIKMDLELLDESGGRDDLTVERRDDGIVERQDDGIFERRSGVTE